MEVVHINKFDNKYITSTNGQQTVLILGRRETGKTFLVRDILSRLQDITVTAIVDGTAKDACLCRSNYMDIAPKTSIIEEYKSIGNRTYLLPLTSIVFDACFYNPGQFTEVVKNGIVSNYLTIIADQYPQNEHLQSFARINFIFLLKDPNIDHVRKIFRNYDLIKFISLEDFNSIFDTYTQNHGCLVIKTNSNSTNIKDKFFWYKAAHWNLES